MYLCLLTVVWCFSSHFCYIDKSKTCYHNTKIVPKSLVVSGTLNPIPKTILQHQWSVTCILNFLQNTPTIIGGQWHFNPPQNKPTTLVVSGIPDMQRSEPSLRDNPSPTDPALRANPYPDVMDPTSRLLLHARGCTPWRPAAHMGTALFFYKSMAPGITFNRSQ